MPAAPSAPANRGQSPDAYVLYREEFDMPAAPAVARFHKLIDTISRLYVNARRVQVQFAWETGRLIVVEEQDGKMRGRVR